ncbi:MAG: hypothetical protein KJ792_08240 [Actinobacteria bacterium]|nr:hypothetical protein [Actinomycetota bacterium]
MRRRAVGLVLVLVAVLSGCAGIPTSGQVNAGDVEVDDATGVVALPEGPQPGATPRAIVEGFMLAGSAGLSGDFSVARQFLAGDVAQSWDPSVGTTIASQTTLTQTGERQFTASLDVIGKVDKVGRFAEAADARESVTFDLIQVDSEWRISEPPAGLVVSERVFQQQYRSAPLYFVTLDGAELVPDVRYYPVRNLATSVVRGLLAGPSPWLQDAVTTAVPDGIELKPEAVTIGADGTAQVVLQPAATVIAAPQRGLLLAQITHSLDLPGIRAVSVRAGVDGALLDGEPTFAETDVQVPVMLAGDSLVQLTNGALTPVAGIATLAGLGARAPAVDLAGNVRVALSGTGSLVRLPTSGPDAVVLASGGNLAAPSVDRFDWVWTARQLPGEGLTAVGSAGQVVRLAVDWLAGRTVTALRVSRDGTRVAVVSVGDSGTSIDVAGIVRDKSGAPASIGVSIQVGASLTAADQLVWLDASTLVVLGHVAGAAVLSRVPVTGPTETLPTVSDAVSVAADVGERTLLVATSDGDLRRYDGRTWVEVPGAVQVRDPAYPG